MKRVLTFLALAAAIICCSVSCKKDKRDLRLFSATVTFKPQTDGTYFMEIDDSTAAVVLNESLKAYPFEKPTERRAIVNCVYDMAQKVPETLPSGIGNYKNVWYVEIAAMDTILTKKPVVSKGSAAEDAKAYGSDPIGLYLGNSFPTTVIEDGYLNVCFNMPVGMIGITHELNLVTGIDDKDPYTMEFRHNANGDYGINASGARLVCFPLKDLPDTDGKTVTLTLKWNSAVSGKVEEARFKYKSRTDW
ncbi:MAG: hypothetical protein MJY67_04905 [Bacteroidales bacterium]|nr:hypothetical protein [Bacteroidales bacterium]